MMNLRTTADLPRDMQFDPEAAAAVRATGLTIECRHGDPQCPACIREAAQRLTATIPTERRP